MNDPVVRFALFGPKDRTTALLETLSRLRSTRVEEVADIVASEFGMGSEFDAAAVSSVEDAFRMAEGGKHVFLADLCIGSMRQTRTLIELCRSKGVTLAVGGLPRNSPACAHIIDQLRSRKLGEPGLLRVHRWSQAEAETHIVSKSSTAALLFGDIDLALRIFGETPTEIYAIGRDDHAYVQVHLGFSNGGMALLDFARGLPSGQGYNSVSLIGSTGAAYADDHHNSHLLFTGGDPRALMSNSGDGLATELEEFVDCITKNQTPEVDADTILKVHQVLLGIQAALKATKVLRQQGDIYEPG